MRYHGLIQFVCNILPTNPCDSALNSYSLIDIVVELDVSYLLSVLTVHC